jgi:hypothetical protein
LNRIGIRGDDTRANRLILAGAAEGTASSGDRYEMMLDIDRDGSHSGQGC